MPTRTELIENLKEMATLLELDGANSFRVAAFNKAVRALENENIDLNDAVKNKTLTEIDGIGKGLAERIGEYWDHGHIAELDGLRDKFPPGLLEITQIPGVGAKKARALFEQLEIESVEELEKACEDGSVAGLKGFGKKTAQNILEGISQHRRHSGRFHIDTGWKSARRILETLREVDVVERIEPAGSLRRWRETVKDLDFVCATRDPETVMKVFTGLEEVASVTGSGKTKSSVRLHSHLGADLRCVEPAQFPYALMHFTGSKEHNVRMRQRAIERGLKLNEYGLFLEGSDESLPAETEEEIHRHLELKQFIPPEMREDMGEIDAAASGRLPERLVERNDVIGIYHMHTIYSDGRPGLEDYARWAAENGIAWMGITDHSQAAAYAGGLKPDEVRKQWKEIDALNKQYASKGVRLLKGIEADILADGSLDYDEDLRAGFEFVVASVHSRFNLPEKEQTERILHAIANPHTTILGHLTGRLLLKRDGYAVDQKRILEECGRKGVIVEINANPQRLDLDWRLIRYALEQGCWIGIGPDAHAMGGLDDLAYGIGIARKGWLTPDRLINALGADEFLEMAASRARSRLASKNGTG